MTINLYYSRLLNIIIINLNLIIIAASLRFKLGNPRAKYFVPLLHMCRAEWFYTQQIPFKTKLENKFFNFLPAKHERFERSSYLILMASFSNFLTLLETKKRPLIQGQPLFLFFLFVIDRLIKTFPSNSSIHSSDQSNRSIRNETKIYLYLL